MLDPTASLPAPACFLVAYRLGRQPTARVHFHGPTPTVTYGPLKVLANGELGQLQVVTPEQLEVLRTLNEITIYETSELAEPPKADRYWHYFFLGPTDATERDEVGSTDEMVARARTGYLVRPNGYALESRESAQRSADDWWNQLLQH